MSIMRTLDFTSEWRLRRTSIGTRLRVVFALIVLLMFIGNSFALWYLRGIRNNVERVSLAERRVAAVLQVDNSILALMNRLHRSADLRNYDQFEAEAVRLLAEFRSDIEGAALVLH